jgi:hypothetical protein
VDRFAVNPNLWEDEVVLVPPAPARAWFRRAGKHQSPQPRHQAAGLPLPVGPSPRYERCGWRYSRSCPNGKNLPAGSAIGKVASYRPPVLRRMLRQSRKKDQSFVFKSFQKL